ncbi:MAG: OmpA family protein [Burkholderiaceae bacterium]|nr:OmpA family protein [Burkholderiaceae bacterium]
MVALLSGCQHAPPVDARATRMSALKAMGFEETAQGMELNLSDNLLFDFNSDALKPMQRVELVRMGRQLVDLGIAAMRVEGHSDNVGTDEYNTRLSVRRAQAVSQALVESGFAENSLATVGFGAQKPIADNTKETGRAQNRRVTLIVSAI